MPAVQGQFDLDAQTVARILRPDRTFMRENGALGNG
jgi:hypothetical protein